MTAVDENLKLGKHLLSLVDVDTRRLIVMLGGGSKKSYEIDC